MAYGQSFALPAGATSARRGGEKSVSKIIPCESFGKLWPISEESFADLPVLWVWKISIEF